jgi:dihydroneopterin aldolase
MTGEIILDRVRIYAYHGVLPQERTVGANFLVTVRATAEIGQAVDTDELDGTIDYSKLLEVVQKEMAQPSKLVEHVAGRIGRQVLKCFPTVSSVIVEVIKENPPMAADCNGAGIKLCMTR